MSIYSIWGEDASAPWDSVEDNPMTDQSYKERAEKAEAACAEMRLCIQNFAFHYDEYREWHFCNHCGNDQSSHAPDCRIAHALSSDCGKGWLSPQQAEWLNGEANRMEEKAQRLRSAIVAAMNDPKTSNATHEMLFQALEETK